MELSWSQGWVCCRMWTVGTWLELTGIGRWFQWVEQSNHHAFEVTHVHVTPAMFQHQTKCFFCRPASGQRQPGFQRKCCEWRGNWPHKFAHRDIDMAGYEPASSNRTEARFLWNDVILSTPNGKNDWNESRDIDDFYSSEVRICLLCDQAGWRWCLWSQRLRLSVSTLLRHSLPFFIIFCWENSWNTRTGERSIVQPEVLDNQYKIRSDASQPIVVRWSKDSDVVGWMNEWMILHVSFCSFSCFTKTVLNCHAILGRSWRFQKRRTASHWILPFF